ncbi:MAG: TIGR03619 family F420-dependent LLM class oxidoreductase, partial [Chloroflexota bacterium]
VCTMRLALVFSARMFIGRPLREMIDLARAADDAGLDYVCLAEHVINHAEPNPTNHTYGPNMHTPVEPWPEPLTTLSAFAGATQRIGLMTGILIAPLRPGVLLAKTAASVHALSGGRLVMGVSTSWQEEEYNSLNVPFKERGAVLNDNLGACRALWGNSPASFHSQYVNFDDMLCEPRPDHAFDIPIWFGGKFTPRLVRRVVELGNGWIPFQAYRETPDELAPKIQQLRDALSAAGRDPAGLDVAYWMRTGGGRSLEEVLEDIPAMAAAGITVGEFLFAPFAPEPETCPAFFKELSKRLEAYRGLGLPGGSTASKVPLPA